MLTHLIDPLDYPCDGCNAEPGEPCRWDCLGLAAAQDLEEGLE